MISSQKRDTGSRSAAFMSGALDQAAKATSGTFSVPIPQISPGFLWPADRQSRMLRLGIAGAGALVLMILGYAIFSHETEGGDGRRISLTGHTGPVSSVAFSPRIRN